MQHLGGRQGYTHTHTHRDTHTHRHTCSMLAGDKANIPTVIYTSTHVEDVTHSVSQHLGSHTTYSNTHLNTHLNTHPATACNSLQQHTCFESFESYVFASYVLAPDRGKTSYTSPYTLRLPFIVSSASSVPPFSSLSCQRDTHQ